VSPDPAHPKRPRPPKRNGLSLTVTDCPMRSTITSLRPANLRRLCASSSTSSGNHNFFMGQRILRRFGASPSASNGNPNFFSRNPVLTSFVTGGLLWGAGDMLAQSLEKGAISMNVDSKRLAGTLVHGSFCAGIGGYYWYSLLDKFVNGNLRLVSGTLRFVLTKLAFEFFIFHPVSLMCYWWIVGRCEGNYSSLYSITHSVVY